jgi:D-inositol-3-phosphate glycosyltransferase
MNEIMNEPKKLLWVGDAGCATGFSRATHKILETLSKTWNVVVLGIGYNGDPHGFPYDIYPAFSGGDMFGVGRIAWVVRQEQPDVIVLQNDPWNIQPYLDELNGVTRAPVVASLAIDGLNCQRLDTRLTHCIFWTKFAEAEAKKSGYAGPSSVIPLGVDLDVYRPMDQAEARATLEVTSGAANLQDAFIVGNVNRNQPRKRLDLTIAYFAEWIKTRNVHNAFLFLHVCPTGEKGCDIRQFVRYHGIQNRVILADPDAGNGVPEAQLACTYAMFDVMLTTTQGEGFGLPTLEGLACGIPQIVPNWSALGLEGGWLSDGCALHVPCTSTSLTAGVNVIGGVASKHSVIEALDQLYQYEETRSRLSLNGLTLAQQSQFRWEAIGSAFDVAIASTVERTIPVTV